MGHITWIVPHSVSRLRVSFSCIKGYHLYTAQELDTLIRRCAFGPPGSMTHSASSFEIDPPPPLPPKCRIQA